MFSEASVSHSVHNRLTMLATKAYIEKSRINSAKQLPLVGIESGTSCVLL